MKVYTMFKEYFTNREYYTLNRKNFWRDNKWVLLASLVTFVVAVLARSWPNFVNPNLYVEDTTHYFNYFYGNVRDYSALFHNTNGYINIINNLLAKWVALIDVRMQPYVYTWIGTFFCIVASMSLSFSGILKNKYLIFITPFLLGFSGLNHLFYYVTLTYQIYVLVIVLLTMLFWEPIRNNFVNFLFFLLLSLLIWSGPYSVLTVPLACGFILFFKGKTKMMCALLVVTVVYVTSVNESTIWLHNILNEDIRRLWRTLLVERIIFMDSAGSYGTNMQFAAIGIFLVTIAYFRKDTFYLKVAFLLFGLINGALAALLLSKKIALYQRILPCHLVIAQFLWLFLVAFTVDRFLTRNKKLYHGGLIVALLFTVFIVYDNIHIPDKRTRPLMPGLETFLQTIHEVEQLSLVEENKQKVIYYGDNRHFKPNVTVGIRQKNNETVVEKVKVEAK